ncbi:CLUMA_CG019468, isoform A [Clunio marinus]|uniref:Polypeptide N-acetylgalactosaminyltransferase n=1 Tax=Clunio marinus TaxID=568069 RepID=A0A1J1J272_9DIPT|nr:CLUMA_CG019468, isoform A [Clunio marinus]
MKNDELRTGFGEHGEGVKLIEPDDIKRNEELFKIYGMSVVTSDKISVNRSIPDFRHPECLKKRYLKYLPPVSIIIIFNNEIFSVFKRTLHSLYNRTPHELIKEVILVNDNSTFEYLYDSLKSYIDDNFSDIYFKIINLESRHGLMRARMIGVEAAQSEFVFMMEPHCEMTYNWLPPLIEPLLVNIRTVTVPIVDNVEYTQLNYYENDRGNLGSRGVFDWDLEYQKLKRFSFIDDQKLEPFLTPIMTGGIFMIRKSYFQYLGPYDEELLIWGAENIEMSLKIHLCGGQLLEVPCSRIGHIFRAFTKSRKHESGKDFLYFNRKRIVEVWFEEFKNYVYRRHPERYNIDDVGNLTKPMKIREELNCKSFSYFLEVIAPDLLRTYPLNTPAFASGRIQLMNENLCLESSLKPDNPAMLKECQDPTVFIQEFELSWYRDIRMVNTEICLDFHQATFTICHLLGGNQIFKYDLRTKQIISVARRLCLQADIANRSLKFDKCDETLNSQKWVWSSFVNETMLDRWKESGRAMDESGEYYFDEY